MSDPQNPDPRPDHVPTVTSAPKRNVLLSILMVIGGLVLLLPGVCALIFSGMSFRGGGGGGLTLLWLVCMLISAGGIALIVKAFR